MILQLQSNLIANYTRSYCYGIVVRSGAFVRMADLRSISVGFNAKLTLVRSFRGSSSASAQEVWGRGAPETPRAARRKGRSIPRHLLPSHFEPLLLPSTHMV